MAYDEALAQRVLDLVAARDDVSDRRMFGGWALMLSGHMACGVVGDDDAGLRAWVERGIALVDTLPPKA